MGINRGNVVASLLCFAPIIVLSDVARAQSLEATRKTIEQQDALLSECRLIYSGSETKPPSLQTNIAAELKPQADLLAKADNSRTKNDAILLGHKEALERSVRVQNAPKFFEFSYNEKGLSRMISDAQLPNGEIVKHGEVYDGKNTVLLSYTAVGTKPSQLSVMPDDLPQLKDAAFLYKMSPGPNVIMGRGLSRLRDITIKSGARPNEAVVSGRGPDGSKVVATVERNTGLARLVRRFSSSSDRLINETRTEGTLEQSGVRVARRTTFQAFLEGGTKITKTYQFRSVRIGPLPEETFSVLAEPGTKILDSRLGDAVVHDKTSPGAITMDDVLVASRERLKRDAEREEASQRRARKIWWQNALLLATPVLILVGGVGVWILWKKGVSLATF